MKSHIETLLWQSPPAGVSGGDSRDNSTARAKGRDKQCQEPLANVGGMKPRAELGWVSSLVASMGPHSSTCKHQNAQGRGFPGLQPKAKKDAQALSSSQEILGVILGFFSPLKSTRAVYSTSLSSAMEGN